MRQRGFLLYVGIAAAVAILGLGIALKVQSSRLEGEQAAHSRTKASYEAFVLETKRLGLEAQKKADAERLRQEQVNKERTAGYEKRLSAINAAYARLRDGRTGAISGAVSAIPDASIRAADSASDNRLLEALRAADEQTARLIELQQWVREQKP